MTTPAVFYAGDSLTPPISELRIGAEAELAGAEGHHAAAVKRVRAGEIIDIVDGLGLRARCEVVTSDKTSVGVRVRELATDSAALFRPEFVLVQALAKNGRDEQAVEAAIELGANQIIPWQSERAIVQWKGAKATRGQQKWQALALAAMKQSRRSYLPQVSSLHTSAQLCEAIATACADGDAVFVLHEGASTAFPQLVTAALNRTVMPTRIWLLVGPEGGISDTEIASFVAAGATIARLGPYVTRSATAGPAALAVIGALSGLWKVGIDGDEVA